MTLHEFPEFISNVSKQRRLPFPLASIAENEVHSYSPNLPFLSQPCEVGFAA